MLVRAPRRGSTLRPPRASWVVERTFPAFFRGEALRHPLTFSFASICPRKMETEGSMIKRKDNGASFAQTPSVDRKASCLTVDGSGQGSVMHARSPPDAIGAGLAWLPGSGPPLRHPDQEALRGMAGAEGQVPWPWDAVGENSPGANHSDPPAATMAKARASHQQLCPPPTLWPPSLPESSTQWLVR